MAKTKVANKKKRKENKPKQRPAPAKAVLQHVVWESVELEQVNPLLLRHFVVGRNVMLARIFLRKGSLVPLHSHNNEQISYVLEGALRFWIDDKEVVVRSGEVLLIPPNLPHKIETLEVTLSLDIFDPPRADWINKTDAYLRKAK
jgi:quercetin dioxygenase-like cupin family protein